jgi:hypothetical protein
MSRKPTRMQGNHTVSRLSYSFIELVSDDATGGMQ